MEIIDIVIFSLAFVITFCAGGLVMSLITKNK